MESPKTILERHGLSAKASWGQNFLCDEDALERIALALELSPGQRVVELGPGLGHLTQALLGTGAQVIAVERDRDMVRVLESLKSDRLRIVEANAAKVDLASLVGSERVAVAGNLPYHLSSPILFRLLDQRTQVSRAVFTLQREVVARIAAPPGSRTYGVLSALLGLYFELEFLFVLPPSAFHPAPAVDSAVLRMTALPRPRAVCSDTGYRRLVKAAFAQRRKTLLNALRGGKIAEDAALREALRRTGVDGGRRAETLSCEEFANLEAAIAEVKPDE